MLFVVIFVLSDKRHLSEERTDPARYSGVDNTSHLYLKIIIFILDRVFKNFFGMSKNLLI